MESVVHHFDMQSVEFLIVGGGAAGMCAALSARIFLRKLGISDDQFSIMIAERNVRLGIKILISGGGKCNITHSGEMTHVLSSGFFKQNEKHFLKPAFYELTNDAVIKLLNQKGVSTYTRDNGRVFPLSGRASDVLSAFESLLSDHHIEVSTSTHIKDIRFDQSNFISKTKDHGIKSNYLLIATGGLSYSKTGTTGDGLKFAQSFGHTLVKPSAALAPITLKEKPSNLIGVSIRDKVLIAQSNTRRVFRRDDFLITHVGISGPACLSISRDVAEMLFSESVVMRVDLFPDITQEELENQFIMNQQERSSQYVRTFFQEIIPDSLVSSLFLQSQLSLDQKWHDLPKVERKKLIESTKRFLLGEVREVPLERGEVSAGGVSLKEVNPKTMQSRLISGLYFAGEVLDIAGEVGGYNLQAAYSTGWCAGEHCANRWVAEFVKKSLS